MTTTLGVAPKAVAAAAPGALLITQVQTGGTTAGQEFVELASTQDAELNVTGWKVAYSSSTDASTKELATLQGVLPARGFLLIATPSYVVPSGVTAITAASEGLAATGGHVRIFDEANHEIDKLGWGTATNPETAAAPAPAASKALLRNQNEAGVFVDTGSNQVDFQVVDAPTPRGIALLPTPEVPISVPEPPDIAGGTCDGVIISEILPNPASTDTDHEFIELHNPTVASLPLDGCTLKITSATKVFTFPAGTSLQPGQYRAFFDGETDLTLPNAAGGEVVLSSATTEYPIAYQADLGDDQAWALISGTWQMTTTPTPNAANVASAVGGAGGSGDEDLTPCPAGKYRNPATNRCKTIESADEDLAPCKPGQTRNPETNRCRNAQTASATLTPCKEGQERNPETNRCRSVTTASTDLKPCDPGEERNPETNRCRKAASTGNVAAATTGKNTKSSANKISYGIMAGAAAIATGYGLYEYRHDLRNRFASIKSRLPFSGSGDK